MIRCSNCDKNFDENKITGICPYCGAEKGLINEVPQRETDNSNAYSNPKSDIHYSKDRLKLMLQQLGFSSAVVLSNVSYAGARWHTKCFR